MSTYFLIINFNWSKGRTQEEAHTKIIDHVKHCLLSGFRIAGVKTDDKDVITLLLAHLPLLNSPWEIEVDLSFAKDRKFCKINNVWLRITPEQQLAFMFFSTFTSCDIHPRFLTYQKVLCEMYGARMHTSMMLSLN